jgi:N6-L-threonylcarbamoyladenine synthase
MIDAIAVGHRPGLIGSLLVGVAAAKALAWSLGKPLVGVDHVEAHLYSGMLGEVGTQAGRHAGTQGEAEGTSRRGLFPALGLVVSGGHTAMYHMQSWDSISRIGSTIDDALGEAYDKAATIMDIPYPGGPNLDRLACEPGARDDAFELPVSRLSPASLDFSFSGLKTAVLYTVRGVPGERSSRGPVEMTPQARRDLAASFQKAASRAIVMKLERAIAHAAGESAAPGHAPGPAAYRTLFAGGGVTLNSRLRTELAALAARHNLALRLPLPPYCMDNAAMIGGLAFERLRSGRVDTLSLQATPIATR